MTTGKLGPRCTAEYLYVSRPVLAADASARLAGRAVGVRDWRCVREPHTPDTEHLALPAGVTGQSFRFSGVLVDMRTCPTCTTGPGQNTTGLVCQDCGTDYGPPPAVVRTADTDQTRRLIDLINQPGTTAVHVNDGDELLLLLPDADENTVQRSAQALAEMFPTVSFLVLAGVTGAVVMPKRTPPTRAELLDHRDHLIEQGVDPDQLLIPDRRPPLLPIAPLDDDQA